MEMKAKIAAINASEVELDALRTMRSKITDCFDTLEREKVVSLYNPSSPQVLLWLREILE